MALPIIQYALRNCLRTHSESDMDYSSFDAFLSCCRSFCNDVSFSLFFQDHGVLKLSIFMVSVFGLEFAGKLPFCVGTCVLYLLVD